LGIVGVFSGENFSGFGQFYIKKVSNFEKSVLMRRMKWITRISQIVSNVQVPSHNKDTIDIDFSILEILES